MGYPEVEKLLLLSKKLHVSLDALLSNEIAGGFGAKDTNITGSIMITSPHENTIVTCHKVTSTGKMKAGKNAPQYALFGSNQGSSSFWGESPTFLGWYANEESISKEIEAIHKAILQGTLTYTLQYSVKTKRRWGSVKIVEE